MLRMPLVSIDRLLSILQKDQLADFIRNPLIGEAIRMASPSFYDQVQSDPTLSRPALQLTALKYILRLSSRCTPFGRFAGCCLGDIANQTMLDMPNRQLMSHYQLDMHVLILFQQYFETHPSIRPYLKFSPNTSLYQLDKQLRYTESAISELTTNHFISQLTITPAIKLVIRHASQGATINQLVRKLIHHQYTETDAYLLIEQLIADQVLISEVYPTVTGPDVLSSWLTMLEQMPHTDTCRHALAQIKCLLTPSEELTTPESAIRSILIEQFSLVLPDRPILQCNSYFTSIINQLNSTICLKLQQTLDVLFSLSSKFSASRSDSLSTFRQAFYARYEEREIPLAVALDPSLGVGYGPAPLPDEQALLEGILPEEGSAEPSPLAMATQQWLLKLYTRWQDQTGETLHLTAEDIQPLPGAAVERPATNYYALGYFLASSSKAIDAGDYQFVLKALGGCSPFPLMGRFCRDNAQLTEQIQSHFSTLQQGDNNRIYAEIAHLPSIRAGNVIQRPHLSPYEIPYLTRSTLPREQQILLADLWISVPGGHRVVLRSRRLGKEIVPRLTTAHNYQMGLPLYQFLGDLQLQDTFAGISWQWGWLSKVRHLPRIQYKQVILKEARWRLEIADINPNLSAVKNVANWRQSWGIPRFIALEQGDQELFLDLAHTLCQDLLIDTLQRLKILYLIEWLRTPDRCCVTGSDGRFTHEVIIPFICTDDKKKPSPPSLPSSGSVERVFVPGSQWLYIKIYTSPEMSSLVQTKLGRLARKLVRNQQVTHWFFIHYKDPDYHLRFRFHLAEPSNAAFVLQACQHTLQPFIAIEVIHRLQVDTYVREIERYGFRQIDWLEWLFWVDSDWVIQLRQVSTNEADLLTAAIMGADAYLTDFGLSLSEKIRLCDKIFTGLFREHGESANSRKAMAKKYRHNEAFVKRVLHQHDLFAFEKSCQKLFQKRSHRLKPFLERLLTGDSIALETMASLVHLFINRLFTQHQRTYELLTYHHLLRGYQSLNAYVPPVPQSLFS